MKFEDEMKFKTVQFQLTVHQQKNGCCFIIFIPCLSSQSDYIILVAKPQSTETWRQKNAILQCHVCYFHISVDQDTLFKESDFVSAHTALTPETAGKIVCD